MGAMKRFVRLRTHLRHPCRESPRVPDWVPHQAIGWYCLRLFLGQTTVTLTDRLEQRAAVERGDGKLTLPAKYCSQPLTPAQRVEGLPERSQSPRCNSLTVLIVSGGVSSIRRSSGDCCAGIANGAVAADVCGCRAAGDNDTPLGSTRQAKPSPLIVQLWQFPTSLCHHPGRLS